MKKFFIALLFIIVLSFIWFQSVLPTQLSSAESSWIANLLRPVFEFFFGEGFEISNLVRKIAHYTEFAFLGIFSFLWFRKKSLSFFVCFIAAFLDETIQIFSGRGPSITDVWIDLSGAFVGVLVALIVVTCKRLESDSNQ